MKFLIQKINGEIVYDFAFTLLESIRYNNWIHDGDDIKVKFLNTFRADDKDELLPFEFKSFYYRQKYVPIGSVEFVNAFLRHFYGISLKPINVPGELFPYANRTIFNGTEKNLKGKMFVKSNDYIKGTCGIWNEGEGGGLPEGNYQFSDVIHIDSEWRAFVYNKKLVGLQNYSGEFTMFPNIWRISDMIIAYKSAPIAYTLDIGVFNVCDTFVIECHPMASVGLYGMSDHKILPHMFYRCFWELVQKEGKNNLVDSNILHIFDLIN
jgi:hypothetical protein